MGFIEKNVIPGERGRVFGTDASRPRDFERIAEVLLRINGVTEVIWNHEIFPIEVTIKTDEIVSVEEIEKRVSGIGFHVIPTHALPF